jgi:hypothetical protein
MKFEFSSKITQEEIDRCFLPFTNEFVSNVMESLERHEFRGHPADALTYFRECGLELGIDQSTQLASLLSSPFESLDTDAQLCAKVFYDGGKVVYNGIEPLVGLQNYVAILDDTIFSAPNNDGLWPYGRFPLTQIDGNVGAKLIHNVANSLHFDRLFDSENGERERHYFRASVAISSLRSFGSMLCNFADTMSRSSVSSHVWEGFWEAITFLNTSKHPGIDQIVLKRTIIEIVDKYTKLRRVNPDTSQLREDISYLQGMFPDYEEIRSLNTLSSSIEDPGHENLNNLLRLVFSEALVQAGECPGITGCTSPFCCLFLEKISLRFAIKLYPDRNSYSRTDLRCLKFVNPDKVSQPAIAALATLDSLHRAYSLSKKNKAIDIANSVALSLPPEISSFFLNRRAQRSSDLDLNKQIVFYFASIAFPDDYLNQIDYELTF